MVFLLSFSRWIDRINETIGKGVSWLVLMSALLCSLNAIVLKYAKVGSVASVELEWYLFAAVFLLSASYTLKKNGHVRIDVVSSRLGKRANAWIDIFGFVFFLLPMASILVFHGTAFFLDSLASQETSGNSALVAWPAKLLIPVSFSLLALQGISELVKRIAFLRGMIDSSEYDNAALNPEEEIAAIANASNIDVDQAAKP